jgi:hypothetical protein
MSAIDWIGYRYSHGYDLYSALCDAEGSGDWGDSEVTFTMREYIAWNVKECIERADLACFAPEFKRKLLAFCEEVV